MDGHPGPPGRKGSRRKLLAPNGHGFAVVVHARELTFCQYLGILHTNWPKRRGRAEVSPYSYVRASSSVIVFASRGMTVVRFSHGAIQISRFALALVLSLSDTSFAQVPAWLRGHTNC